MRSPLTQKQIEKEKRELYFKEAILNAFQTEGKQVIQETEEFKANEIHPTQESREEFWRRLNRARRITKWKRRTILVARRACYCLLAFLVAGGIVITAVPPVRAKIGELLTSWNKGTENTVNLPNGLKWDSVGAGYPTYLPVGYEVVNVTLSESVIQIQYSNGEKVLFYLRQSGDAAGLTDHEELDRAEKVPIGEKTGYYTAKDGFSSLIWNDEKNACFHTLQGDLPIEELVRIARSVQ